jgi:hypothetical protein
MSGSLPKHTDLSTTILANQRAYYCTELLQLRQLRGSMAELHDLVLEMSHCSARVLTTLPSRFMKTRPESMLWPEAAYLHL